MLLKRATTLADFLVYHSISECVCVYCGKAACSMWDDICDRCNDEIAQDWYDLHEYLS